MSLCLLLAAGSAQALPFAVTTPEGTYRPGENTNPDYQNPDKALGEPALDTGFGDVTPFNGPFSAAELVQVGGGGELIIGFDHRVLDDPLNPFGIDLLVFGNAFFFNPDFSGPVLALDLFAEEGMISVSQDLATWVPITSVVADGLFPTQGYLDTTGPFADDGTLKADFTLPVDPSIDWVGADFATIVAL